MKSLANSAIKYFALFVLVFGALTGISLVPQVGAFCNHLYRQPTEPVLQALLPQAYLQLTADDANPQTLRVEFASKAQVQQQLAQAGQAGQAAATIEGRNNLVNFYNLFLSFFLFYAALVLLSPVSWKGKIISLATGAFLFYLYTVFKLYLSMLSLFNQPDIGICHTGATMLKICEGVLYFMTLGTNVLVVLLLWAALVLKKNNWTRLLRDNS